MTTAQDPIRRSKQKARRRKKLAAWRLKKATGAPPSAATKSSPAK